MTANPKAPPERVTHGRHCLCGACAAEDWPRITGPCGMHGGECPAVYAPLGAPGDRILGVIQHQREDNSVPRESVPIRPAEVRVLWRDAMNAVNVHVVSMRTETDCMRAAVATIFGVAYEAAPDLLPVRDGGDLGMDALQPWIWRNRWPLVVRQFYYYAPVASFRSDNEWSWFEPQPRPLRQHDGLWLATVRSTNMEGRHHAVVMDGLSVFWDPSPSRPDRYEYVGETWFEIGAECNLVAVEECECGRGVYGCEKCRGEFA